VEDAYPLSMLQAGMLFHMDARHEAAAYHNVTAVQLRARFDAGALQRAVDLVVARHAVLRTGFDLASFSEPLQLVHRTAELPVVVEDVRSLPAEERRAAVSEWMDRESTARFELARPPLIRLKVHRSGDDTFWFTITECHPILDGWSFTSTIAEIFQDYSALLGGREVLQEPPPAAAYRDFIALERAAIEDPGCQEFWRGTLEGLAPSQLPRPPAGWVPGQPGSERRRYIPFGSLAEELDRAARTIGVPLNSLLLAAHAKVLGVLTNQRDVVTGISVHGRPETIDGDKVRGLFLNTVPFRLRLDAGTWEDLARRTFEAQAAIVPYRRYPAAVLQRSWGRQPIFETAFNYTHFYSLAGLNRLQDVELISTFDERALTTIPMMATFERTLATDGAGLVMAIICDGSRFSEEQVESLTRLYTRVLEAIAADPGAPHDRFSPLGRVERERLLGEWNEGLGEAEIEGGRLLVELFREQVSRSPGAPAAVCGERRLSYAELEAGASRVARELRRRGVGPDCRVGLCVQRSLGLVVGLLGILEAGAAYVPLDPGYPVERLAYMVEDAGVELVVLEAGLRGVLGEGSWAEVVLEELEEDGGGPGEVVELSGQNLAYVIYTSGSSGRPKGVGVTHGGLSNYLQWARAAYGVDAGTGAPVHSSIGFDLTVTSLLVPLVSGGWVELLGEELGVERLGGQLNDQGYGLVKLTPAHLGLLGQEEPGERGSRGLVIGGENLLWASLEPWRGGGAVLWNEYGPTETVVGCASYRAEVSGDRTGSVPIGRAITNMRLYVLDRGMEPVPVGVVGELYIGGVQLARGYLGQPGLTAERFLPDPHGSPGARLYRSGDLARWQTEGELEYVGRADQQVKIRGYRIELGEIEGVLGEHGGVTQTVVMAREDGASERRLVAYYVAAAQPGPGLEELREHLRRRLPEHMLPAAFVELPQLPLTPNGKIDRRALPVPDNAGSAPVVFVAPRSTVEEVLASLWSEILDVEQVGVHDSFFELGGHSLLAIQLITRMRDVFDVEVPLREFFDEPTVGQLAQRLLDTEPVPGQTERIAAIAHQIGTMSPEELEAALAAGRGDPA
jgi:amino acid adenylation domain-containing protein